MSYIDVQVVSNKKICVWERGSDGKLVTKIFPFKEFNYLFMRDNTGATTRYHTIYDEPLRQLVFNTRKELSDFKKLRPDIIYESDVPIKNKLLIDEYHDCQSDLPVNILYFDIEVDFDLDEGRGYPTPKNPYGEINAISTFHSQDNIYTMFIPSHLEGKITLSDEKYDGYPVQIVWCDTEAEMLRLFSTFLDEYSVDILTAWFGSGFDLPYIMARAELLFGESAALTLLCRDGFEATRRDFINDYAEEVWEWKLAGRHHVDLMKLYKKFQPGEKRSFKLDSVCEEELGEKKIAYQSDLGTLYRKDPQHFFEYSLHDARLLMWLDRKKKIVDLAILMARDMCCLPPDVTGSVKIIEMGIIKYGRHHGGYVFPDKREEESVGEQYEGAVVYDVIRGLHHWVCSHDCVSLYPKTMIMLGLSKETMLYQCLNGYDDYIKIIERDDSEGEVCLEDVRTGEKFFDLPSDIETLIRSNGWTISGNGTIFSGKHGIISRWLVENFELRKLYKAKSKEAFQNGNVDEGEQYHMYQNAIKIGKLNAVYGAMGNVNFRFFDIRLAKSITITAQLLSKQQAFVVDRFMENIK